MSESSDAAISAHGKMEPEPIQCDVGETPPAAAHLLHFYEDDDVLLAAVASFLRNGLSAGEILTVIATEEHSQGFRRRLGSLGIDTERACAAGQLAFRDAHDTLSTFMCDGEPDGDLFQATVGGLISNRAATANGAPLRAYGEMVDILWKRGDRGAAVRLEELWNDLQTRHSFTLLCAYSMGHFYKEPASLQRVSGTHTHVVGHEWDGACAGTANLSRAFRKTGSRWLRPASPADSTRSRPKAGFARVADGGRAARAHTRGQRPSPRRGPGEIQR